MGIASVNETKRKINKSFYRARSNPGGKKRAGEGGEAAAPT